MLLAWRYHKHRLVPDMPSALFLLIYLTNLRHIERLLLFSLILMLQIIREIFALQDVKT